ncbi:hypothetical protein WA158_008114 [Blastocystis sp. Blastoise]
MGFLLETPVDYNNPCISSSSSIYTIKLTATPVSDTCLLLDKEHNQHIDMKDTFLTPSYPCLLPRLPLILPSYSFLNIYTYKHKYTYQALELFYKYKGIYSSINNKDDYYNYIYEILPKKTLSPSPNESIVKYINAINSMSIKQHINKSILFPLLTLVPPILNVDQTPPPPLTPSSTYTIPSSPFPRLRNCDLPVGIRNLGNTCYMNSFIQLLSNSGYIDGLLHIPTEEQPSVGQDKTPVCYVSPHVNDALSVTNSIGTNIYNSDTIIAVPHSKSSAASIPISVFPQPPKLIVPEPLLAPLGMCASPSISRVPSADIPIMPSMTPNVPSLVLPPPALPPTPSTLRAIQELICDLRYGSYHVGIFSKLIDTLTDFEGNKMDKNTQFDLSEFCNVLFDKIEKEGGNEWLENMFYGNMCSCTRSLKCSHVSLHNEPFTMLTVNINKANSVEQALPQTVDIDELLGDNQWKCEECNKKVNGRRHIVIDNTKPLLMISINRIQFDYNTMARTKINSYCSFPMILNVFPYTYTGLIGKKYNTAGQLVHDSLWDVKDNENPHINEEDCYYELIGILVHNGTADSGHYYYFGKSDNHMNK